jgi:PEP-CTERM motif
MGLNRILSTAALIALLPIQPVSATRTAVDGGAIFTLGGYCSPNSVGTPDCSGTNLPVAITLGGTTYNSFWVNSNGTVSLQSIGSFLATQNSSPPTGPTLTSLTSYGSIPVFSPSFADGPGFQDFANGSQYDGNYVADTTLTANGFSVNWYSCGSPLFCGPRTVNLLSTATFSQTDFNNSTGLSFAVAQHSQLPPGTGTDQDNFNSGRSFLLSNLPVYSMTLTSLSGGFQVDYSYNPDATGSIGLYGFNLPTAQFENTGPLTNRTFVFNSVGSLISGVPEPSTWMSMLLGFGLVGFTLRRKRRLIQAPA